MTDNLLISEIHHHDPKPRFMPDLDPDYELNELAEYVKMCGLMGFDPQPWQRRVIQVATQYKLNEKNQREYRYKEILVTVPRQCGKTTLVAPLAVLRAILNPQCQIYFSAQSGQYAGDFMKDQGIRFENQWNPALRAAFTFRRSNGSESFQCTNGSLWGRFTRGPGAMHGKTPILVFNDEIWSLTRDEGIDLDGAIGPAQSTLGARAQNWHLSTQGTVNSDYLNNMCEIGRAGTRSDLCYVEYSLPAEADPTDISLWADFHPALGNTVTLETLHKEFMKLWQTAPGEWQRAYCNQLVVTEDGGYINEWDNLPPVGSIPDKELTFAVEVSARSYSAVIMCAWIDENQHPHVMTVKQAPGLDWVVPVLTKLREKHPTATIVLDKAGPNTRIYDRVRDDKTLDIKGLALWQRNLADAALFDHAKELKTLRHDHSKLLSESIAGITVRQVNGQNRIDRDKSETDPAPAIATAVAIYGALHPEKKPTLRIFV